MRITNTEYGSFILIAFTIILASSIFSPLQAQRITGNLDQMDTDFVVNEDMLIETSWRYQKTTHAVTGEDIHNADDDYDYYLNLKYDYTYEYYLNGKRNKGTWLLNDESNELYYNFRNIKWWRIADLSEQELILEFTIGKGVFYYFFTRVDYKDTPFQRPINELPRVKVKEKGRKGIFGRKKDKPKKTLTLKKDEKTPIEIQMIGGGFYGGINPMVKNFIHIKTNGRCIIEQESLQDGESKRVLDIPRSDLEKFVAFAESKDFFKFDRTYDCVSGDCMRRKRKKPTPIPLRLSIRYGDQYHIVIISIYGEDDLAYGRKYVKYPKELDLIVEGIYKMTQEY